MSAPMTRYALDLARGGRTVHLWEYKKHPFWGSKLRALCCEDLVQAEALHIRAEDKRCAKCRVIADTRRSTK